MSTTYAESQARLAEAVQYAQGLEKPVLGAIAKRFKVDRMTLLRRLDGGHSRARLDGRPIEK